MLSAAVTRLRWIKIKPAFNVEKGTVSRLAKLTIFLDFGFPLAAVQPFFPRLTQFSLSVKSIRK